MCGQGSAIKADVSKEDQVQAMFKQTINHFGTVDICVPNAGLQRDFPLHEMPLKEWQLVFRCQSNGSIFMC